MEIVDELINSPFGHWSEGDKKKTLLLLLLLLCAKHIFFLSKQQQQWLLCKVIKTPASLSLKLQTNETLILLSW